jgi:hypothetical protein
LEIILYSNRIIAPANEVTTLDWPAGSPHHNPIENIWGIMAKEINNKILPQNRQELGTIGCKKNGK